MRHLGVRSLGFRMVLLFALLLAAIAGFMLVYFPSRMTAQAESSARQRALALVEVMASNIAPAVEFDDADNAGEILAYLAAIPDARFAVVNDRTGVALASWRSPSPHLALPLFVTAPASRITGDLLVVSAPIRGLDGSTGAVHLGFSLAGLRAERDDARAGVAIATAVVFGVGLLVCILLASLLTRPIHRLTETARRIARGDLPPRLTARAGGDEVGQMTQALDVMLERLDGVHSQLLAASRHAGMAQVATGILHNVGNVLTSVNVDVELLHERASGTTVSRLQRGVELLAREGAAMDADRRQATTQFLAAVAKKLDGERDENLAQLTNLRGHVEHIKRVVVMQNAHARVGGVVEAVDLRRLLDEAIAIACPSAERHGIVLTCQAPAAGRATLDPTRVLQIVVNLIANARDAVAAATTRTIAIDAHLEASGVVIAVQDSGSGIAAEHLGRLFGAGFTTKPTGHGFGLHSSAQAARQLGGTLTCASDGPGRGATFTLSIPLAAPATSEPS